MNIEARKKECERKKEKKKQQWAEYYHDELQDLYQIFITYHVVEYDQFVQLAYQCSC